MIENVYIRATHEAGSRSGQWAEVVNVKWVSHQGVTRLCYEVQFIDHRRDWWPIYDQYYPYEFKAGL